MPQPIDIGVLGSINEDRIEHPDGRVEEGLGGVLFTACALAHLGQGEVRVWLLARCRPDLAQRLRRELIDVPGLQLDGLLDCDDGYRCSIRYDEAGDKTEVLRGNVEALSLSDLAPILPALQGLIVNFITGFETQPETLQQVRSQFRTPIWMDIHSLTLGRRADGTRFPRRPDNIESWLRSAQLIQLNELEAAILGADTADADTLLDWATGQIEQYDNLSAIVITRGDQGALAVHRDGQRPDPGMFTIYRQAAAPVADTALDPTGCGDVFLAALAASSWRNRNFEEALAAATQAAARNCTLTGIDQLYRLTQH